MFTKSQEKAIVENWGRGACYKILRETEAYAEKWNLSDLYFSEHYSMNAIFYCDSERYGACVLKIGLGFQDAEFISEYNVLREYDGRRFVRVFESGVEAGHKIMLMERISPGTMLKDEQRLDKRLAVFSELFAGMHIAPANAALYQSYAAKANGYAEYIISRDDCKELQSHMARANAICASVCVGYPREMLLHGDMNFGNILLKNDGKYAAVDPQGLLGDPVFDIPRYVLSEYYHSFDIPAGQRIEKINHIIEYISGNLNIPHKILRQCFYVEIATFECWRASTGDYDIDNVLFAEGIMG